MTATGHPNRPRPFDSPAPSPAGRTSPNRGIVPLIDAAAAGELLAVPESWIRAEARAERIPHVRLGRYVRFDAAELEAWWLTRRRGPWRDRGEAARTARTGSCPVPREPGGKL